MQFFRRLPVKLSMEKRRFLSVLLFLCVILSQRGRNGMSRIATIGRPEATQALRSPGEEEAIRATALYRYP